MRKTDITRHDNFVPPGQQPPRVEILPPVDLPPMLPVAQTSVELRTNYVDRSKGFQIATLPISIAFGLGSLVVAIVGFSVPIFSLAALAVFWLAFLGWWIAGWLIHHVISVEGIAFLHTVLMWRYIYLEGKERRKRYGNRN
jgi:hypothetical protein